MVDKLQIKDQSAEVEDDFLQGQQIPMGAFQNSWFAHVMAMF